MVLQLYHRFLGRDKPLRHPLQHVLVGLLGYVLLSYIFPEMWSVRYAIWFGITTFVVDLDGLISIYTSCRDMKDAGELRKEISKGHWERSAVIATSNHKKFNRLFIHNVVGFTIAFCLFIFAIHAEIGPLLVVTGAVLTHFLFDIWDDYWQLGHIRNWLWPIVSY